MSPRLTGALALTTVLFCYLPAAAVHLFNPSVQSGERFGASLSELRGQVSDDESWLGLLVGAPDYPGDLTTHGRVYFWFGGTELSLSADLVLSGSVNERFGHAVQRVGDLNDDGWDDFAVGAPEYDGTGTDDGRVYVYFGGPSLDGTVDVMLNGADTFVGYTGGQFGFSVSAAGDLNGDGDDDLLVGAPYTNAPGLNQGAAFVYYGGSDLTNLDVPDVTFTGEVAGDLFGWSLSDAGNFFGGNEDCIVVGAPSNDFVGIESGAAYVFEGSLPPFDPDTNADLIARNSSTSRAYGRYGFAVRGVARWSGDSYWDIVVGAPFYDQVGAVNPGRIEIFFGGSAPSNVPSRYVNGEIANDYFGFWLADAGNVAGFANDDLLVGAPGRDEPQSEAGRAYIYEGGATSYESAASLNLLPATSIGQGGDEADDEYGFALCGAGDFDGDGNRDIAIGAPGGNTGQEAADGYVHLIDSSGTVTPTFLRQWTAAWGEAGTVLLQFKLDVSTAEVTNLSLTRFVAFPGRASTIETVTLPGPPHPDITVLADGTWLVTDRPQSLLPGSSIAYTLTATMSDGREISVTDLAGPPERASVTDHELLPAHPNPFNPRTQLAFRAASGTRTVCRVVDLRGRIVRILFDGRATGLWQQIQWDGSSDAGKPVAAGPYLVQLRAGDRTTSRRVVLAK